MGRKPDNSPILATKLYIPPAIPNLVRRPRLTEQLDQTLRPGHKLTLISVPAGSGKSTLLSEWIRHLNDEASASSIHPSSFTLARASSRLHPSRVAWLSLDEGENEPGRFLLYLRAAALIEASAEAVLKQGQIPLLLEWLNRLPPEVVRPRPYLGVYHAWALFIGGQLEAAERHLREVEAAISAEAEQNNLQGMIAFIRSAASQDPQEMIRLGRQALELLPEERESWRGSAYLSLGLAYKAEGQVRQAAEVLSTAMRLSQAAGNRYAGLYAMSNLAEVQRLQGQLRAAERTYQAALQLVAAGQGRVKHRAYLGWAYIGLGQLLYEFAECCPPACRPKGQASQELQPLAKRL